MKLIRTMNVSKDQHMRIAIEWLEVRFTPQGMMVVMIEAVGKPGIRFEFTTEADHDDKDLDKLIIESPPPERMRMLIIDVEGDVKAIPYQGEDGKELTRHVFTIKEWRWADNADFVDVNRSDSGWPATDVVRVDDVSGQASG